MGLYPRARVESGGSGAVSQAGAVLLVGDGPKSRLNAAISAALAPWRKPRAVHDDKARFCWTLRSQRLWATTAWPMSPCCGPRPTYSVQWRPTPRPPGSSTPSPQHARRPHRDPVGAGRSTVAGLGTGSRERSGRRPSRDRGHRRRAGPRLQPARRRPAVRQVASGRRPAHALTGAAVAGRPSRVRLPPRGCSSWPAGQPPRIRRRLPHGTTPSVDAAEGMVDRGQQVVGELHAGGGGVGVDLFGAGGAGDRGGDLAAAQDPGERQGGQQSCGTAPRQLGPGGLRDLPRTGSGTGRPGVPPVGGTDRDPRQEDGAHHPARCAVRTGW